MKKHLFALGAASVMALGALSGSVFATDVTGEGGTADAIHTVGKSYIINIPGKINLAKSTDNATGTANVSASKVLLGVGETLTVSVRTSTGKLQASSGAVTSEIPYTIAINGGSAVNATTLAGDDKYSDIFTMAAGTTTQADTPLVLTTTSFDGVKLAAEHKDTLTFKVSVDMAKTMQNIANLKASFDSNPVQQLMDTRDGKKYWVSNLSGYIVMTQNLDYVPTGATWDDDGILAGDNVYYANGIAEEGTTLEGVAIDSELRHYAGGSYYTWDAAMVACPAGWTLPDSELLGGLAYMLNETGPSGAPFYGVRAGDFSNGVINDVGYNGVYWSSTKEDDDVAYDLGFGDGYMDVYDDVKEHGFSVRCVATE